MTEQCIWSNVEMLPLRIYPTVTFSFFKITAHVTGTRDKLESLCIHTSRKWSILKVLTFQVLSNLVEKSSRIPLVWWLDNWYSDFCNLHVSLYFCSYVTQSQISCTPPIPVPTGRCWSNLDLLQLYYKMWIFYNYIIYSQKTISGGWMKPYFYEIMDPYF